MDDKKNKNKAIIAGLVVIAGAIFGVTTDTGKKVISKATGGLVFNISTQKNNSDEGKYSEIQSGGDMTISESNKTEVIEEKKP